jgi:hypothetical protein
MENRPKQALILNLKGHPNTQGKTRAEKTRKFFTDPSPDHALISLSRPLSVPNTE